MIAGFSRPDCGRDLSCAASRVAGLPPFRRDIGMVFQDYALFPHMTVAENVAFGLGCASVSQPRSRERVAEALDLVQLDGLASARPQRCSGGSASASRCPRAGDWPTVLLLDEPLSIST